MGEWVFEQQRGPKRAPHEAELFKAEQSVDGEYAGNDALVREILQNAIDARHGGPVRVRLALHESQDAPSGGRLAGYFSRLCPALTEREIEQDLHGAPNLPCRFLVCEDFGTTGLEGDPYRNEDPEQSDRSKQYFYWFWRNIGRSGKTGEDLGRWGLGKTVYRAASRTGCMIGYTVRASDGAKSLMGQAVLNVHRHEGEEFAPEGYWCGGLDGDGLALPIMDTAEIAQFLDDWRVTRREQPGLSVVAPYVHEELDARRLLEAVIVHFFIRIVRGDLVVEVEGKDQPLVRLDADTIESECAAIQWNGPARMKRHLPPPIRFARACIEETRFAHTSLLGKHRIATQITSEDFDGGALEALRADFAAGARVSVRVKLWLPRKYGSGAEGEALVFLQKHADGRRCESYAVREGMTITKIRALSARAGVQSLVLVEPGNLAELLGDTEGAAHEDWQTTADRPDLRWKTWKGRVKFVRKIVDHLVEALRPPLDQPDFDRLSSFFSIKETEAPQRKRKQGEEAEEESTPWEGLQPTPRWYQLSKRADGGFTLGRNKEVPMPEVPRLRIQMAYDLSSGNPLRKWSPFDFRLTMAEGRGVKPQGRQIQPERVEDNVMEFTCTGEDFKLLLRGFDPYRDLYVRVEELEPEEASA